MTKNRQTNFKVVYELLKKMEDWKFSISHYHHDFNDEPFLSIEKHVERLTLDYIDEHGLVITISTGDVILSFSEKNYTTNISNGTVVFASNYDNETHCFIDFC